MIEGFLWGGLLQQTTDVENYPGFPAGIMGPELMQQMRDQAERFGTRFITDHATKIELGDEPGGVHTVWVGDDEHQARTVILAMGAEHKKLGVPGEEELSGRGVSYCATCDAAFFKDKPTIIVGGGDSRDGGGDLPRQVRLEGHDRPSPRRVPRLEDHARPRARRSRTSSSSRRTSSRSSSPARRARSARRAAAQRRDRRDRGDRRSAAPSSRSATSRSREIVDGQVEIDDEGYVITEGKSTRTNLPGVFAAGDLVDHTYRQAITAAGSGCQAALDAEWYLRDTPEVPTPEGMPEGDLAEAQWAPTRS